MRQRVAAVRVCELTRPPAASLLAALTRSLSSICPTTTRPVASEPHTDICEGGGGMRRSQHTGRVLRKVTPSRSGGATARQARGVARTCETPPCIWFLGRFMPSLFGGQAFLSGTVSIQPGPERTVSPCRLHIHFPGRRPRSALAFCSEVFQHSKHPAPTDADGLCMSRIGDKALARAHGPLRRKRTAMRAHERHRV